MVYKDERVIFLVTFFADTARATVYSRVRWYKGWRWEESRIIRSDTKTATVSTRMPNPYHSAVVAFDSVIKPCL